MAGKRISNRKRLRLEEATEEERSNCGETIASKCRKLEETNLKVRTHFKDVMDGSKYVWVDPNDCIPFTRTRPISESGVKRLMALFDGSYSGSSISGGGIACGTDTPIIVELCGTLQTYIYDYFRDQGHSESVVKERVASRRVWYGIIDGEHSYLAIKRLIETIPRWSGYTWFVTLVKSGHSIEKYRQLARIQNERHDGRYYIQYTFFDIISNMRSEFERLSQIRRRVTGQDVADAYCGYHVTSKKTSTLVQMANTVMRLPTAVINTIGAISNHEHPDLVLTTASLNKRKATSVSEVMEQEDCRVFRKFLHITSLKSAKNFMNANHKYGELAQIYTIYRVQEIYRDRSFSKAVQPDEVSKQYEHSIYSIEEENKFLRYLHPDSWPVEMTTVRENLLKTTQMGEEVVANHGNKDILPSLKKSYQRHFPAKFIVKEQLRDPGSQTKDKPERISHSGVDLIRPVSGSSETLKETGQTEAEKLRSMQSGEKSEESKSSGDSSQEDVNESSTAEDRTDPPPNKLEFLKEKGIQCFNMRWQEFLSEEWKSDNKRVDAIITNPPESPSLSFVQKSCSKRSRRIPEEEELTSADIIEIAKAGKRLLKPTGYFIIMTDFELFSEWYLAFTANGYNVMKRPLTFEYKQEHSSNQRLDSVDFPHLGINEYCVVARLHGVHPDGFNPNFNSSYNLIRCDRFRSSSIVTNVELPKNRLCYPNTRKPLRLSEKPVNLMSEILDLFVPAYGSAVDLFGGTLTLPISALKTSRRCIAVEKDKVCFDTAVDRLHSLCKPVFKFVLNKDSSEEVKTVYGGTIDASSDSTRMANDSNSEQKSISTEKLSSNETAINIPQSFIEETSRDVDDVVGPAKTLHETQTRSIQTEIGSEQFELASKTQDDKIEREAGAALLQLNKN